MDGAASPHGCPADSSDYVALGWSQQDLADHMEDLVAMADDALLAAAFAVDAVADDANMADADAGAAVADGWTRREAEEACADSDAAASEAAASETGGGFSDMAAGELDDRLTADPMAILHGPEGGGDAALAEVPEAMAPMFAAAIANLQTAGHGEGEPAAGHGEGEPAERDDTSVASDGSSSCAAWPWGEGGAVHEQFNMAETLQKSQKKEWNDFWVARVNAYRIAGLRVAKFPPNDMVDGDLARWHAGQRWKLRRLDMAMQGISQRNPNWWHNPFDANAMAFERDPVEKAFHIRAMRTGMQLADAGPRDTDSSSPRALGDFHGDKPTLKEINAWGAAV